MLNKCLCANQWQAHRALSGQYFIANTKVATAQITFATALTILATFTTLISIRFFIMFPMNSVSELQEFIFLVFYTALILGGYAIVSTSISIANRTTHQNVPAYCQPLTSLYRGRPMSWRAIANKRGSRPRNLILSYSVLGGVR